MISLTIMLLCGIAGLVCLFSGAIGPGLGFLVIAGILVMIAGAELNAADQKRRDKFLIAYEKAQREAEARRRNYSMDEEAYEVDPASFDEEVDRRKYEIKNERFLASLGPVQPLKR